MMYKQQHHKMLNQQQNQRMIPQHEKQDRWQGNANSIRESIKLQTEKVIKNNQTLMNQNASMLKLLNVLLVGIIIVLLVLMIFSDKLNSLQMKVNDMSVDYREKQKKIIEYKNIQTQFDPTIQKYTKQEENSVFHEGQHVDKQNNQKVLKEKNVKDLNIQLSAKQALQLYKKYKIQKRVLYNPQNYGKRFAKLPEFIFNISEIIPIIQSHQHSMRGDETQDNESTIFVIEPRDFDKLFTKVNFDQLQKKLSNSISYQVLQFQYDKKVERKKKYIAFQKIRTQEQFQKFMKKIQVAYPADDEGFKIAYQLYIDQGKKQSLQAQFYYANKKYNISKNKQQIPMCIISTGRNLYSRRLYRQFFQSLQKINYTNYHIVYVDDFSQDNSAYQIYNYVRQNNFTLKNNLKIVHNFQNLGCLANVFFWVKKYCNEDDIVVNIDGDDAILLPQAFQILNSVYTNNKKWFVYSKFVVTNSYQKDIVGNPLRKADTSLPLNTTVENYRRSGWFMTSHLRTYKQKLMKAVPIYEFMEYHFDRKTGLAYPTFPFFTSDVYQVYSLLELAGEEKIQFLTDYLYLYFYGISFETRNCYRFHQLHDNLKASLKPRLSKIQSLDEKAKRIENDTTITQYMYNRLQFQNNQAMQAKCYLPTPKS